MSFFDRMNRMHGGMNKIQFEIPFIPPPILFILSKYLF
jgi:hypothetical protein